VYGGEAGTATAFLGDRCVNRCVKLFQHCPRFPGIEEMHVGAIASGAARKHKRTRVCESKRDLLLRKSVNGAGVNGHDHVPHLHAATVHARLTRLTRLVPSAYLTLSPSHSMRFGVSRLA
jgi:hypothetical protein